MERWTKKEIEAENDRKMQKNGRESDGGIKGRGREKPGERHIDLMRRGQGLAEGQLTSSWPKGRKIWGLWLGLPWGGRKTADSGVCSL